MRPPEWINASEAPGLLTGMTTAVPKSSPNSTLSPALAPGMDIRRTAVVLLFWTPIAISSAMIAAMVSSGVSPGTAAGMNSPGEHGKLAFIRTVG